MKILVLAFRIAKPRACCQVESGDWVAEQACEIAGRLRGVAVRCCTKMYDWFVKGELEMSFCAAAARFFRHPHPKGKKV